MTLRTMMPVVVIAGLVGGAAVLGLSTSQPATASPAPATVAPSGSFAVEAVHSGVVFRIKHSNAANFYGTFKKIDGTFSLGDTASLNATVKADSVDTANEKRDQHVRSPDFFSAKEFPEITFTAKSLAKKGDNAYAGTGDLTFRGVTKPIEISLAYTGSGKGPDGAMRTGVEARATIKRTAFGSDKYIDLLSDEVELIVFLEGLSK